MDQIRRTTVGSAHASADRRHSLVPTHARAGRSTSSLARGYRRHVEPGSEATAAGPTSLTRLVCACTHIASRADFRAVRPASGHRAGHLARCGSSLSLVRRYSRPKYRGLVGRGEPTDKPMGAVWPGYKSGASATPSGYPADTPQEATPRAGLRLADLQIRTG